MDSAWHPWIGSVAGSMLVGLSGIVPLLVFPDPSKLKNAEENATPLGKPAFQITISNMQPF